jgi:hypothetical protein
VIILIAISLVCGPSHSQNSVTLVNTCSLLLPLLPQDGTKWVRTCWISTNAGTKRHVQRLVCWLTLFIPLPTASFTSAYFYASRVCQRTQQHYTCQQAGIAPVDRL